jgi:hypothetical protein
MTELNPKIIERLNNYFSTNTFRVEQPMGKMTPPGAFADVKVLITGDKEMTSSRGQETYITYSLIIQNSSSLMNHLTKMFMNGNQEIDIDSRDMSFYLLSNRVDEQLNKFLKYFSVENPVICTKVIDETNSNLNENIIMKDKLNDLTKVLVEDIFKILDTEKVGNFTLPEDLDSGEMIYSHPRIEGYTVNLHLSLDENVESFEVDGDLRYGDNTINVYVVSNPNMNEESIQELNEELNEVVRHELEHVKQCDNNLRRTKEPKDPEKYYTQQKELEAQRAGFRMRPLKENVTYESLIRKWFKKYHHRHTLTLEQQERVIQKILSE